jgi:acetolactate synthase-1/2/3 large subunit
VAATLAATTAAARTLGVNGEVVEARRARHLQRHATLQSQIKEAEQKAAALDAIDPVRLVQALRDTAVPDTIFVDETITHARLLQQHLQCGHAGSYYYVQGGLGQGIAVALGVKLATRDRPVVLAIGDGSFLYNPIVQSLAAARDNKLPLLIVVFNNRKYLSMKFNHLRFYPDGAAVANNEFHGVDLGTQPELSAFAEPFGMLGLAVNQAAELEPALREAQAAVAAGRTAIVNVMLTK